MAPMADLEYIRRVEFSFVSSNAEIAMSFFAAIRELFAKGTFGKWDKRFIPVSFGSVGDTDTFFIRVSIKENMESEFQEFLAHFCDIYEINNMRLTDTS